MKHNVAELRFGSGWSRLWCTKCKAETVHHKGTCGCGTQHTPEMRAEKPLPFLAGRNAKAMTRRKA